MRIYIKCKITCVTRIGKINLDVSLKPPLDTKYYKIEKYEYV
jgi:hypothetical protein